MMLDFLHLPILKNHDKIRQQKVNLVNGAKGLYYCNNMGGNGDICKGTKVRDIVKGERGIIFL